MRLIHTPWLPEGEPIIPYEVTSIPRNVNESLYLASASIQVGMFWNGFRLSRFRYEPYRLQNNADSPLGLI
jgi:hypothetical protein